MVERVSKKKLREIRRFVKQGHSYDDAVAKFNVGKTTVLKAVKPKLYEKWQKRTSATAILLRQMMSAGRALEKILSQGLVISFKDLTGHKIEAGGKAAVKIHIHDTKTGFSLKVPEKKKGDK